MVFEEASLAFVGVTVVTPAPAFVEVSATVRGGGRATGGEASPEASQLLKPPRRLIPRSHRHSNVWRRL
jgi:hypothetical protein